MGSFLYDYRGLRIQKQAPGITRYTHDDQAVLFQSDASGNVTHRFEYGPDRLLSLKPATQASEFYLLDALNSPIALVRGDGTLTARYSYDAWGNKRQDTGTSSNPFGFTGHEHDDETGLIYAKARYYDPETARFLSQDPWSGDALMPPSLNKYLYAYQNPTVYVDPDGRAPVTSDLRDFLQTLAADQRHHTRTMNQQMGGSFLGDLGRRTTNTFTSIGGGLLEAAGAGVNMVDLALDTALTVHPLTRDTAVGQASSERIATTRDTVQATASAATRATRGAIAEHGVLGAGGRLASSAGDAASTFMGDVFVRGDLEAAGAFQSGLFSAALPGAGYARATRGVPQGGTRQVTIAESHAGPAGVANETSYLYRGVSAEHPALEAAKKGNVVPGNINGTVTPDMHNAGGYADSSPFTSWTRDPNIAAQHAAKHGDGGVILRVPQGAPSKDAQWNWEWSPDIYGEQEVLMRGVRHGVEVLK